MVRSPNSSTGSALAAPNVPLPEEAFGLALEACRELGDQERAEWAHAYLSRFSAGRFVNQANRLLNRNGNLVVEVYDHLRQRVLEPATAALVPINSWFHIVASMLPSADAAGQFALSPDNVRIIDVQNVSTTVSNCVQCNVGALSPNVSPSPAVLFIDGVRLGPPRAWRRWLLR